MSENRIIADFRVDSPWEAEEKLAAAVAAAEAEAYADRTKGVLITRHDFNRYSVVVSANVPFGVTVAHDSARR